MQREISNNIQLVETLNPLNEVSAVSSIDITSVFGKVDKLGQRNCRSKFSKIHSTFKQCFEARKNI